MGLLDILQFLKSRRSIRKFIDKPVEPQLVARLLEAARYAPSAGNCQPWRFVVVTDPARKKKFDPYFHQPWVEKAPVVIVVLAAPDETRRVYGPDSNWYIQDCAAATQNILLMAHGSGLGAVWVGAFSKDAVRKELAIPAKYEVFALVCVGYYETAGSVKSDGQEFANDERRHRKSLGKIAFSENLDRPWEVTP